MIKDPKSIEMIKEWMSLVNLVGEFGDTENATDGEEIRIKIHIIIYLIKF